MIRFDFEYPDGLDNLPLYSGKIQINSSLGESLSIPYLGEYLADIYTRPTFSQRHCCSIGL